MYGPDAKSSSTHIALSQTQSGCSRRQAGKDYRVGVVSGQEDDGDVERLPHSEGKGLDSVHHGITLVAVHLHLYLVLHCRTSEQDDTPVEHDVRAVLCSKTKAADMVQLHYD